MADDEQQWSELRDELKALRARIDAVERELDRRISAQRPVRRHDRTRPRAVIETRLGLTLLNRIGVVTLIIGAAFFFKYAVDSEWIGPWMRVLFGVAVGGLSLVGAEYLSRRDQAVFAHGIAGLGMALPYVAVYAGFDLYHLYGAYTTLSLVLLLVTSSIWIARKRDWLAVELLAVAGATYLFAASARDVSRPVATLFLAGYYVVFELSRRKLLRHIVHVVAGLGIVLVWEDASASSYLLLSLVLAALGLRLPESGLIGFWLAWAFWQSDPRPLGTSFVAATLAFGGYYALSLLRSAPRLVTAMNAVAYFTASFLLLDALHHAWMGVLALAAGATHFIAGRRGRDVQLNFGLAAAFVAIAVAVQFAGFQITVGWAVEAAALAFIGQRTPALAILGFVFLRLAWFDVNEPVTATLVNGRFIAFLASALSYWFVSRYVPWRTGAVALYVAGHMLLFWAGGLEIASWAARNAPPSEHASIITAGLSILGAAYAVALIAHGILRNAAMNRVLGLILIAIVIVKLYAYDVWLLARLYRTTAFIALGVLLLLGSYVYSSYRERIEAWWRERG